MRPAPARETDWNSEARHYSGLLLLLAIASLLVACGGGGQAAAVCATGPAPAVLTWDAVPGAIGYRIHYDTAAGMGTNPQVVEVPGGSTTTTTVTTGLTSGTTYYFAATALNGSGESNFSNFVCKTIY